MGKSTISIAMFNSYVSLPEGNRENPDDSYGLGVPILRQPHESSPGDNLEL